MGSMQLKVYKKAKAFSKLAKVVEFQLLSLALPQKQIEK